jgi:hypothetical protein
MAWKSISLFPEVLGVKLCFSMSNNAELGQGVEERKSEEFSVALFLSGLKGGWSSFVALKGLQAADGVLPRKR